MAPRGTPVPITGEVLAWAVRESGYTPEAVAEKLGVPPATLREWITESSQPTVGQFRQLATFLKRQEAVFFLPRAPRVAKPRVQFRHPPGVASRPMSPRERLHVREAARLQRGIAWVLEELGDEARELPRVVQARSNAEAAAAQARAFLGVPVAKQREWESASKALRGWRAALEDRGVSVLLLPMRGDAARGFSLWHARAPLIAANTHWNAQARSFTLFHEFGHLLTRTNSVCADVPHRVWDGGDQVERWCEEFAAALLLPWDAVESFLRAEGWNGRPIQDLDFPSGIAETFHVSLRAAVLRLIGRGHATWPLYRSIPAASDTKVAVPIARGGRRRYEIALDELGERTARVFLRGVARDAITRDDALAYLDVADTDFPEIEGRVFPELA